VKRACRVAAFKKQLKEYYEHIKIFYANNSVSDLKDKKKAIFS
jgi:hypothetical protein